jgi:carboxypeptidase family protein
VSRPVVLGLVLLIGAVALLLLWRAPAGRTGLERAEPRGAPEAAEPVAFQELPRAEGPSEPPAPVLDVEDDTPPASRRVEARSTRPSISGTVRAPREILARESVVVRAEVLPKSGKRSLELVVRVSADGSFTLVVPEDTERAELDVESRFLALHEPVRARPGEGHVELRPNAYAAIAGQVVPPLASTPGTFWADAWVSWSLKPGEWPSEAMTGAVLSPSFDQSVLPGADGAFVLGFVPIGVALELHAENPFGPEWIQTLEPLEPAEERAVTITLELGTTISGRVLDEHGQPVEGVRIATEELEPSEPRWAQRATDSQRTDAEGCFVLSRMRRRVMRVSTIGADLMHNSEATVDGTRGDVRDLVLTVVRGGCIEGTVVWADRTPVDVFTIRASAGLSFRSATGQDGRFRLAGLDEGSYRVDVRAKGEGAVGTASAVEVRPGGAPLALVLAEVRAFEARGEVVDREGAPVPRFRVTATGPAPESRRESADGYQGRLLLIGLAPGEWSFEVSASGHQSARQSIVVGEGMAPLRFEVPPAGRVRGSVVDAGGAPVADARVGVERQSSTRSSPWTRTDATGLFDLEARSTRLRFQAEKSGFSPSAVVELEVAPGASVEGIVLRLGESCRVEGRVLDPAGDPVVGAWVSAAPRLVGTLETDARGAFALEGLPSGPVTLLAHHPSIDGAIASAVLTLVPGQAHVVDLRFESADPVRVRGRVTRAGVPVACNLGLRTRSFAMECASGPDGRFEVTLQRPGEWRGVVWLASEAFPGGDPSQTDARRFDLVVPDADEHTLELDFDTLPRLSSMEELFR